MFSVFKTAEILPAN